MVLRGSLTSLRPCAGSSSCLPPRCWRSACCPVPRRRRRCEHIERYDSEVTIQRNGVVRVQETIDYDFGSTPAPWHLPRHPCPLRLHEEGRHRSRVRPRRPLGARLRGDARPVLDRDRSTGGRSGSRSATRTGRSPARTATRSRTRSRRAQRVPRPRRAVLRTRSGPTGRCRSTRPPPESRRRPTSPRSTASPGRSVRPCRVRWPMRAVRPPRSRRPTWRRFKALTFTVALPKGSIVPPPKPVLEERFSLANVVLAHTVHARWSRSAPAARRRGRGRSCSTDSGVTVATWARPSTSRSAAPPAPTSGCRCSTTTRPRSSSCPPDDLRPGQIGTLIDFAANPLDVTATIVDLAVRQVPRDRGDRRHGLDAQGRLEAHQAAGARRRAQALRARALRRSVRGRS